MINKLLFMIKINKKVMLSSWLEYKIRKLSFLDTIKYGVLYSRVLMLSLLLFQRIQLVILETIIKYSLYYQI